MSDSSDDINRREVAHRLFAAEFDDADFSYTESDEERAPNYVITPTGARVNRMFIVGVLTEVEPVNEDQMRARIVDPTGAFVVYAGQYQPEALAALETMEAPAFVAVTGKARTFEPDDGDVVYTSIRPEHISEVDAGTRDRWVVTTSERTIERVSTMAAAHERVERGTELQRVLEAADVPNGRKDGIPLALDHYDTSPAYLTAIRDLALDAARVVADELEEVERLSLAPSEGGDTALDFADSIDVDVEVGTGDITDESETEGESVEASEISDEEPVESGTTEEEPVEVPKTTDEEPAQTDAEPTDAEMAVDQMESELVESADAPDVERDDTEVTSEDGAETEPAESGGEMYELSEEERAEVEENYDVGFSTGSDIPDAGESDIETPDPDKHSTRETDDGIDETGPDDAVEETDLDNRSTETDSDELGDFDASGDSDTDQKTADSPAQDMTLDDYVVELMTELDDGNGAPRDELISNAIEAYDADSEEVEDAIQSALMGGRCYEANDDHLQAI